MTDNQNNQTSNNQNQNQIQTQNQTPHQIPTPPASSGMYDGWLGSPSTFVSFSEKKKECAVYSKWESVGALLIYLLAFLFCRSLTGDGGYLAMTIVCVLTLMLTAAHLIFKNPEKGAGTAYAFPAYALLFAFVPLFSSNFFLNLAAYPAFFLCIVLFLYFVRRRGTGGASAEYMLFDSADALFSQPLSSGKNVFSAVIYPIRAGRFKKAGKQLLYILLGIVAAVIPCIFVLANLSFDSKFTELLDSIFSPLSIEDGGVYIACAIFAVPLSMYFFSAAAGCSAEEYDEQTASGIRDDHDYTRSSLRLIPILTLLTAAIPLFFLYAVFFISQIENYTAAFSSTLPEGFIYSDYARSGFFELCRVAGLNALISFVSLVLSRRKDKKVSLIAKLICVLFSLCSLVLIATALAKMILYIDAYGMTQKRVYVAFFMILMALGFVLCIFAQFIKKLKMTWVCLTLAVLFVAVPAFCGFDSMIHSYNVDRYIDGTLKTVDYSVMYDESALPALEKLYFNEKATKSDKKAMEDIADHIIRTHKDNNIFDRNIANLRADASAKRILAAKTAEKE